MMGWERAFMRWLWFLVGVAGIGAVEFAYAGTLRVTSVAASTSNTLAVRSASANQHLVGRQWDVQAGESVFSDYIQPNYTLGTTYTSGSNVVYTTDGFGNPTGSEVQVRYTSSDGGGAQYFYVTIGLTSVFQYCPAGETRNAVTGLCEVPPPPCSTGEASTMRLGVGYAASTADVDDWINPGWADSACSGSCAVAVGPMVAGSCTVSESSGPPYAGYCDFSVTTTGANCSSSDVAASEAAQNLPPIPCPSGTQIGEVNGSAGCYPVSQSTSETTKTANPDGSETTTTTTTNSDGSQTTTTTTTNSDGSSSSTTTNTPAPYNGAGGEGAAGQESNPEVSEDICRVDPSKCPGEFVKGDGGAFDLQAAQEARDVALDHLIQTFDDMREMAGGFWSGLDQGSAPLPCLAQFSVFGRDVNMCIRNEWLDWLPVLVMLVAAIISGFMLLRD